MTGNELRALLDIATLLALAGRRSFDRGAGYVADGRVGTISVSSDTIEASVLGTDPYHVRVSAEHGRLVGACSCPMGDMGAFCKHCVALSLAWIEPAAGRIWSNLHADEEPYEPRFDEPLDHGGVPTGDVAREYLETLNHDELVDLIVDAVDRDGPLAEHIRLRAEAASDAGTGALRLALDRATFVRSYLDYGAVPAFAAEVERASAALGGAVVD